MTTPSPGAPLRRQGGERGSVNYYNENDPKAAAWLRELIRQGLIPNGEVDERSIVEVQAHELGGFTQHHFFAGVGGWPIAFRLAGLPDDKPARSLSCPCQPFSQTGLGLGEKDPRHLYPVASRLLEQLTPAITFGEQVASAAGRVWLSRVRADMERMGYGVGAADLCSASACPEVAGWIHPRAGEPRVPVSAGPPNIRQRLYWVAYPGHESAGRSADAREAEGGRSLSESPGCGVALGLADTNGGDPGAERQQCGGQHRQQPEDGLAGGVGNAHSPGSQPRGQTATPNGHGNPVESDGDVRGLGDSDRQGPQGRDERGHRAGQRSPWASSVVLPCTDGKARRIEPGSFPLAHGVPGRVGLLRGYGNAINPWLAAEFIQACLP